MKRAVLLLSISVLATVILIFVHQAEAQQSGKIHRIGYLSVRGPDREKRRLAAFTKGCESLGILKDKILLLSTVTQKVRSNGTPT